MKLKTLFQSTILGLLVLTSCGESTEVPSVTIDYSQGAYILYQGQYYDNIPGELDLFPYTLGRFQKNLFKKANGRTLGDTPQCGVAYGSKIYVGTYSSNTIEIFNISDYKSIAQIKLQDSEKGQFPRSMVTDNGKIYISMYDGYVARLDTVSLKIDASVKVGPNPEEIAIHNGKLYVPNSDGMNWQNGYGTTATVVNLNPFRVEKEIEVPINPYKFLSTGSDVFLICKGNYYDVKPGCYKLNNDGSWKLIVEANMGTTFKNILFLINTVWQQDANDPAFGNCYADYYTYDDKSGSLLNYNAEEINGYPNGIGIDEDRGLLFVSTNEYLPSGYPSYTTDGRLFVMNFLQEKKMAEEAGTGVGPACIFFKQK